MIIYNVDSLNSCSYGVKNYFFQINSYLGLVSSNSFVGNFKGFLTKGPQDSILWTPCQGGSFIHPKQVITCHDVIDFSFYESNFSKNIKKNIHERFYKNAMHLVFISDYSLQEFTNIFPSVLTSRSVIKSPKIIKSIQSIQTSPVDLDDFILVITNNLKHKNNSDVFALAALLHTKQIEFPIVMVGNIVVPDRFKYLLGKSLFVLNNISSKDLNGLQAHASLILSTSLVEGHNMPIAEGLGFGKDIITTDISIHKEYYRDMVEFYEAGNINDLFSKTIKHISKESSLKNFSCEQSWETVANEYENLFKIISKI